MIDHIAAEFGYGIPPKFHLNGKGSFEQFGTLGRAYQWSPAVLLKYYFNSAEAKFRPYVGVGASCIYFTGTKLTNTAFERGVLGAPRPTSPPATSGNPYLTPASTTTSTNTGSRACRSRTSRYA